MPDPSEVGHFRPITVFSNTYRTWSSIAARHWLRAISQVVDPFLCGNTTGGRAAMVWRYMLEQLEAAHRGEGDVCGFSADIVKAFNILPRVPALAAVKLLGVDQGTLVGWAGALSGFVRHFVVRGNFSPGVTSVNGFPEGCALSCLAMLALTQLFHRWLQATNVMFTPISYVDNWGVILRNVQSMRQACDAADAFAEALQLDLDKKKSYCWASDRDSRRFLRGEGFAVRLHTKELGAHVVSSCQLSNFHALERFRQLADFWQKLTNSPCVYQQKVTLIMRVAWPRAFHGVSAVVIGRKHFDNLRTCIMQALKLQKPGANPELQCSLEGDLFDPLLYAAAETVRDARSLRDAQHVAVDLNLALFSDGKPAFNTLSEIVGQRLHKIGFEVQQDAQVRDSLGCFNLLSCPLAEFVMRAQWTWTKVLACKVKHRRSFLGFEHVDLISTRRAYKKYNPFDQGILRKYLHGAALANDQAQHWSHDGSQQCQQCGSLDSVRHRLWECPSTQPLREEIPEQVRIGLTLLPEVSLLHGWTLRSPLAEAWNKYLVDLPSQASFAVDFSPGGILDLFTDGSCLYPTVPELRMASWAVVRAPPFSLDFDKSQFVPIAAQPLHGLLQSAYRAELFAVCVARDFTIQCHACARVWSDCQSVLDAFQRYVKDNEAVKPNGLHSDLLLRLQDLAKQLGPHRLAMMKVPAHQQRSDAETDLESWLLDGNSVADTAVGVANQTRPPATWAFWNSYAEQLADNSHASWIRSHMLKVSKLWNHVVPPNVMPAPKPHKPVRHGRQHPEPAWDSSQGLSLRRPTFVRQFGSELASDVYSWLNRIRDPQQSPRYVSFIQLFLSFQRLHGPWHIAKVDGKWMAEKGHLASLANHCKLSVRVKHFRLMVQQYLKDAGVKYTCCTVRPRSDWILCFKGSIGFQSCDEEHKVIEGILATKLLAPATGDGASLESLRGV